LQFPNCSSSFNKFVGKEFLLQLEELHYPAWQLSSSKLFWMSQNISESPEEAKYLELNVANLTT
jgi:hypothetical protein